MWSLIVLVERILLFLFPDCLGVGYLTLEGKKKVRIPFFHITLVPCFLFLSCRKLESRS